MLTKVAIVNYDLSLSRVSIHIFMSNGRRELDKCYDNVDKLLISRGNSDVIISKWFRGQGVTITVLGIRGEIKVTESTKGVKSIVIR